MRVTNAMKIRSLLDNLALAQARMADLQDQLGTQRRIRTPSDDPVAIQNVMRWRTGMRQAEQFLDNVQEAKNWLDMTDSALQELTGLLNRVHELAVRAGSGTYTAEDLQGMAIELQEFAEHAVQLANTQFGDRYLFSGQATQTTPYSFTPPFDPSTAVYSGDNQQILREVGPGVRMAINVDGQALFDPIFAAIASLKDHLDAADHAAISNTDIGLIQASLDGVLTSLSEVGARVNRLEMGEKRLSDMHFNLERLESLTADADMAEVVVRLQQAEATYHAALAVGARITQPTLLDYLR